MSTWASLNLQDANSPTMEQLTFFHDHSMMILITIMGLVSYIMIMIIKNTLINQFLLESHTVEFTWTVLPALTLLFIALPSLKTLYLMEEMIKPLMTIKIIGHQWYWSYEYSEFQSIEFNSYMKPTSELEKNNFRLLEVDNRLILPMNAQIRTLVTAEDVLHSWTLPNLGVKVDAIPGRLNQMNLFMNRPGIIYGQCSEICGTNHSFMPIVVESIEMMNFMNWINKY